MKILESPPDDSYCESIRQKYYLPCVNGRNPKAVNQLMRRDLVEAGCTQYLDPKHGYLKFPCIRRHYTR